MSTSLLEILVCPKCKAKVVQDSDKLKCTNTKCGLVYPVVDGIPVMLVERAEKPAPQA